MKTGQVEIVNKLGLHARAASRLVNVTKAHGARIQLCRPGGNPVDAKSIMAVMMLAATEGTELELDVQGGDAEEALESLRTLISERFGEDQ